MDIAGGEDVPIRWTEGSEEAHQRGREPAGPRSEQSHGCGHRQAADDEGIEQDGDAITNPTSGSMRSDTGCEEIVGINPANVMIAPFGDGHPRPGVHGDSCLPLAGAGPR